MRDTDKLSLHDFIALTKMYSLTIDAKTGNPKFYRLNYKGLKKIKFEDKQSTRLSVLFNESET